MRLHYVEVWEDGKDYDAGLAGEYVKVKARDESHAEDVAMRDRQYEVAEYRALAGRDVWKMFRKD